MSFHPAPGSNPAARLLAGVCRPGSAPPVNLALPVQPPAMRSIESNGGMLPRPTSVPPNNAAMLLFPNTPGVRASPPVLSFSFDNFIPPQPHPLVGWPPPPPRWGASRPPIQSKNVNRIAPKPDVTAPPAASQIRPDPPKMDERPAPPVIADNKPLTADAAAYRHVNTQRQPQPKDDPRKLSCRTWVPPVARNAAHFSPPQRPAHIPARAGTSAQSDAGDEEAMDLSLPSRSRASTEERKPPKPSAAPSSSRSEPVSRPSAPVGLTSVPPSPSPSPAAPFVCSIEDIVDFHDPKVNYYSEYPSLDIQQSIVNQILNIDPSPSGNEHADYKSLIDHRIAAIAVLNRSRDQHLRQHQQEQSPQLEATHAHNGERSLVEMEATSQTADALPATSAPPATSVAPATGVAPQEEEEFMWSAYLKKIGATTVDHTSFDHYMHSIRSGFRPEMLLEVATSEGTYWLASIVQTHGSLLRLRYVGDTAGDDKDFFVDMAEMKREVHPIGWSANRDMALLPPKYIKEKFADLQTLLPEVLQGALTPPAFLFDSPVRCTPVNWLDQGLRLELQHELDPQSIWFVSIVENFGGRLLLRWAGAATGGSDFWLFYLDHRLHPLKWAERNKLSYTPPKELIDQEASMTVSQWNALRDECLQHEVFLSPAIFAHRREVPDHEFVKGMKVEMIHPVYRNHLCPGTVVMVVDLQYFLVEADNYVRGSQKQMICCRADDWRIYPVRWHRAAGIHFRPPEGYTKGFEWTSYIEECQGTSAPKTAFASLNRKRSFPRGSRLEAVNPEQPNQICVASVRRSYGRLLSVELEGISSARPFYLFSCDSHELFPAGWCQTYGYPLKTPSPTVKPAGKLRVRLPHPAHASVAASSLQEETTPDECPPIYVHSSCATGPLLSRNKLLLVPQQVGPGSLPLVLKKVLMELIYSGFVSLKVARELKAMRYMFVSPPKRIHLKVKHKNQTLRTAIDVCQRAGEVSEFLEAICQQVGCCPNLLRLEPPKEGERCPLACFNQPEVEQKRKVRRTASKRTRSIAPPSPSDAERDRDSREDYDHEDGSSQPKAARRPYQKRLAEPTDRITRGTRFVVDRLTHQKVDHRKHAGSPVDTNGGTSETLDSSSRSVGDNDDDEKSTNNEDEFVLESDYLPKLDSNPLHWSVERLVEFLKETDCAGLIPVVREQEIDGQSMLLLTLPTVQECLGLKLGPAIKFCHQVERLKFAFFLNFTSEEGRA